MTTYTTPKQYSGQRAEHVERAAVVELDVAVVEVGSAHAAPPPRNSRLETFTTRALTNPHASSIFLGMNSSYSTKNLPAGTRVIKINQGHYVIEVDGQLRDESFVTKGDAVRFALYKMSR